MLRIADALVLDGKNKPAEGADGGEFAHPKNPLHNLAHPTVVFVKDDDGPLTASFLNAYAAMSKGHTPLLAVLAPGISTSPKTLMIPEVTLSKGTQIFTMWGPLQEATAHAIADLVKDGVIPKEDADKHLCMVQVYGDPAIFDPEVAWQTAYAGTYAAGKKAWENVCNVDWMLKHLPTAFHPFGLGSAKKVAEVKAGARALLPKYFSEGEGAPIWPEEKKA